MKHLEVLLNGVSSATQINSLQFFFWWEIRKEAARDGGAHAGLGCRYTMRASAVASAAARPRALPSLRAAVFNLLSSFAAKFVHCFETSVFKWELV